jgi:NAD(P)-dependent dehydrogenase (short-subunit alcohol dehydrogenase family)
MLVTGASRGLGEAIAELAAFRGYDVCISCRLDIDRANAVANAVRAAGRRALVVQADVGNDADVTRMFEQVDRELGRLDVLVNNAGISGGRTGRVDALDGDEVMRMMASNVAGPLLCSREAIRRMSTLYGGKGGSIINLSSAAGRLGGAGRNVHYAASKGAVNVMTVGLAREVAGEGIRVNAVAPGLIDTESQEPAAWRPVGPTVPMKRAGRPEEVAQTVLWLASDEASYVTGALIDVSGGR